MNENTSFIINKEFKAEELNIQGYDISKVSKARVLNEGFKASCKFDFDAQHLADIIENKGIVYTYKHKGEVLAAYAISRDGSTFTCNDCYHASELNGDLIEKMDQQVAFLVASEARGQKEGRAIFKGVELPKLTSKSGKFSWLMGFAMTLCFGTMFWVAMKNPAGMAVGLAMGVAMGLCFTGTLYSYEGAVTETSNSESSEEA